ncbi:hypothetical protein [Streptomyces mirabilis]|uniref:hypothetical protein n=1 Tax=Streptomyces mirabilis TaxID=68239 RepID=UPI00333436E9
MDYNDEPEHPCVCADFWFLLRGEKRTTSCWPMVKPHRRAAAAQPWSDFALDHDRKLKGLLGMAMVKSQVYRGEGADAVAKPPEQWAAEFGWSDLAEIIETYKNDRRNWP